MISMNEFKKYLIENIKEYLPNDYKNAEVSIEEVQKNNNIKLNALQIHRLGEPVAPNIYIDNFYKDLIMGKSVDTVTSDIVAFYLSTRSKMHEIEIPDFSKAKENIVLKLVNKEMNEGLLKDIPYKIQNDLLITYRLIAKKDAEGIGSVLVKNNMLELMGVNADELYDIAKENTIRIFPPNICSMREILLGMDMEAVSIEIFQMEDYHKEFPMYVVSNSSGINGAAAILYPDVLKSLSEKLGGDLYLLPSSTHEMIVIPADGGHSVRDLEDMVRSINEDIVDPEEVLSNHVYLFDKDKQCIRMANEPYKDINKKFVEVFLRNNQNPEQCFNEDEIDLEP